MFVFAHTIPFAHFSRTPYIHTFHIYYFLSYTMYTYTTTNQKWAKISQVVEFDRKCFALFVGENGRGFCKLLIFICNVLPHFLGRFGRDLCFFFLCSITYVMMSEIYHETHKQEASILAIRAIHYLCGLRAVMLK